MICYGVLASSFGWAKSSEHSKFELFFPIDRNQVRILPQRFEYELVDKDQFRIGNATFDARLFQFEIDTEGNANETGRHAFSMQWPAALLNSGEISIRDNIGKAIWIQPFDRRKVNLRRKSTEFGPHIVASIEKQEIPEQALRSMRFIPYFRACIQKAELPTRISLCSKDFVVRTVNDKLVVSSRDSLRRDSFVNINGNLVDPKGVIFLQSANDTISLRVLLLSGATIDVDTRMQSVDFRDLALSEDGKKYVIWAAGAEPTLGHRIHRLRDESWKTEIGADRPMIYLKGEGDIPMKQEFVPPPNVRPGSLKVEAIDDLPRSTYSTSLAVRLRKGSDFTLSVADKQTSLRALDEETYNWELEQLVNWTKNRRYLNVNTKDRIYVAAWEIEKYPASELRIGAFLPTAASARVRRWFDNRWLGLGLEYKYISTPFRSGDGNTNRVRLPVWIAFQKFIQFEGATWGAVVYPESRAWGVDSAAGYGAGLFGSLALPQLSGNWGRFLGRWVHLEAELFGVSQSRPNFSYRDVLGLKAEMFYNINRNQLWSWGAEYGQQRILNQDSNGVTTANSVLSRFELSFAFSYLF